MSVAPEPVEPAAPLGTPEISEAAQLARERLHEEIERVRNGVEEMLDQRDANGSAHGNPFVATVDTEETRRELEKLRIETRDYVKKKVRKSEKKLERSVRELEERSDELEERIDQVESEREEAEWRIHNNTEQMLDGLLDAVRSIADRLARQPAASPAPAARQPAPPAPAAAPPKLAPPPKAPVGRVGPRPLRRGK
jgi:membrane protein involved in colicin uptake